MMVDVVSKVSEEVRVKVIVIGSGPAGWTAALYAARAGLEPIIICGLQKGGQLMTTEDIENYPGFESKIGGPWLMEQMEKQAIACGAQVIMDDVTEIDMSKRPFVIKTMLGGNKRYVADTVIIATGATAKYLGLPSEEKYKGLGVSACAVCDGSLYKGKRVLVVGGGNTAVEEALYLSKLASEVTLIHRRDELRAEKILQKRLFSKENVKILWDTTLEEILGDDSGVNSVSLRNVKSDNLSSLVVDGVFIAIGHSPNTGLFQKGLDMDDAGYIITAPDSTKTNVVGIFAAGDVQDSIYRQAVTAAGTGCMAALEVEKFLVESESEE